MKKILLLLVFAFVESFSQGVLPISRYQQNALFLDVNPTATTFAYSLRKMKASYSGYALRIRNSGNSATADVFFDAKDQVSSTSNVTLVNAGSSGFSAGHIMDLNSFKGTNTLTVQIWHNQNSTGYNAVQNTVANQPILDLSGGPGALPTLLFYGNSAADGKSLIVQANMNVICPDGRGSFLMLTKPTANIQQASFGQMESTNWRWSFHFNWNDGQLYFDAAEICCQAFRSVDNTSNINVWKQYSFVRASTTRSIRSNTAAQLSSAPANTATPSPNNNFGFGIGRTLEFPVTTNQPGYQGSLSEVIMFSKDLTASELLPLELNQMKYWKL